MWTTIKFCLEKPSNPMRCLASHKTIALCAATALPFSWQGEGRCLPAFVQDYSKLMQLGSGLPD
jgi:hypothetical protein